MSAQITVGAPWIALVVATALLLTTFILAWHDASRPLWQRVFIRTISFGILTCLLQRSIGLTTTVPPHASPGMHVWMQLLKSGWWVLGARVSVAILRLIVVLDGRPRQTKIVSDLLAAVIYTAAGLAIVNFVFELPVRGLIATSGVIAIVLGLALQSTLSDVFSGIAVGLEHAYKIGDIVWVEGGIEGQIVQISWRSTQISTSHNSVAVIPNSVIAKSRIENRSAPTPARSVAITINIDASIDPRRCMMVLQAAVRACRLPTSTPQPSVSCKELQGDGITYQVQFTVPKSRDIEAARTEALALIHRHLRYSGIRLGIPNVGSLPSASKPPLADLMAESDLLAPLSPDERRLFAEHSQAVEYAEGEILIRQGELPDAMFLIAGGTVEVTRTAADGGRVLLRASPADSIGAITLFSGLPALVTAAALTPVSAYRIDKDSIATIMKIKPELANRLEALAERGSAWVRCEASLHTDDGISQPDILSVRLHHFLQRLMLEAGLLVD